MIENSPVLFDEGDAFSFYINGMHYLHSNTPSKTFYASIKSEILRICQRIGQKATLVVW